MPIAVDDDQKKTGITPDPMGAMNAMGGGIRPDVAPVAGAPGIQPDPPETQPGQDNLTFGQHLGALGEMGLAAGTSVLTEPMAGLAGIATLMYGNSGFAPAGTIEAAPDVIDAVRASGQYIPKTEGGQRYAQFLSDTLGKYMQGLESGAGDYAYSQLDSPVAGAAAATMPTAIGELLGLSALRKTAKIARAGKQRAINKVNLKNRDAKEMARRLQAEADDLRRPENWESAADTVQGLNQNEIIELIDADPEFYRAMDELGYNTEPLASFASRNSQYRDIEQALQASVGSQLDKQARAFITETAQKADNVIQEYGGTLDKSQLSNDFHTRSKTVVDDLFKRESDIYDSIAQDIPPEQQVIPDNTMALLERFEREFGGADKMPAEFQRLRQKLDIQKSPIEDEFGRVIGERVDTPPTYRNLDYQRQEVGRALREQSGEFRNVNQFYLGQLYHALRNDVDAVADAAGRGDDLHTANLITKQRKQIEDNLSTLLVHDLRRDVSTVLGQAVKGISGNTERFRRVVKALDKIHEAGGGSGTMNTQQMVLSAMNDAIKGTGLDQGGFNANKFTKFMDDLNRQPQMKKLLFDNLPEPSRAAFDNLHKVAKGIALANQQHVKTGRILTVFDETGLTKKLMGNMVGGATRLALPGQTGVLMGDAVKNYLMQNGQAARRASELVGNPQFQNMLRIAVTKGVVTGTKASKKLQQAERLLMRTQDYQRWAETIERMGGLSDETLMLIGTAPAAYFAGEDTRKRQATEPAQAAQ